MRSSRSAATLLALCCASACARPDHIEIEPRMPHLTHKGETLQLHGRLMDRTGKYFADERVSFRSRDPFVAAVSENGEVAALSSGHAVVTAQWNELTAEVPIDVDLVEALRVAPEQLEIRVEDEPVKLSVTPLGLDGRALRGREVRIVSANPAVARVDPDGRVWGLAPGEAVIHASIDDKEGEIHVRVK